MIRYLVAYYSWTGNTAKVAKAVAERLSADVEEIVETRRRAGPFARFLCAVDAILRRKPPIAPAVRQTDDYDVVVLGCPVWARDMAAPMRSYLAREKGRIGKAAFFCTQAGIGGESVLERVAEASGAAPLAILVTTERLLETSDWRSRVDAFVRQIENAAAVNHHGADVA